MSPPTKTRRHGPDFCSFRACSHQSQSTRRTRRAKLGHPSPPLRACDATANSTCLAPTRWVWTLSVLIFVVAFALSGQIFPRPTDAHAVTLIVAMANLKRQFCAMRRWQFEGSCRRSARRSEACVRRGLSVKDCVRVGSWFRKGCFRTWKTGNAGLAAEPPSFNCSRCAQFGPLHCFVEFDTCGVVSFSQHFTLADRLNRRYHQFETQLEQMRTQPISLLRCRADQHAAFTRHCYAECRPGACTCPFPLMKRDLVTQVCRLQTRDTRYSLVYFLLLEDALACSQCVEEFCPVCG